MSHYDYADSCVTLYMLQIKWLCEKTLVTDELTEFEKYIHLHVISGDNSGLLGAPWAIKGVFPKIAAVSELLNAPCLLGLGSSLQHVCVNTE